MEKQADQKTISSYVFVGGLKATFTENTILNFFKKYGEITSISLKKSKENQNLNKGFCVLNFKDPKIAHRVIQMKEHLIKKRLVTCRKYLKGNELKKSKAEKKNKTIYISNLPRKTTNEEITYLFQRFGEVETGYTLRNEETGISKGFGFVKFIAVGSVEKALEAEEELYIRGVKISVEKFSEQKKDSEAEQGNKVDQEEKKEPAREEPKLSSFQNQNHGNFQQEPLLGIVNFNDLNFKKNHFKCQNIENNIQRISVEKRLLEKGFKLDSLNMDRVCFHPSMIEKTVEEHELKPNCKEFHFNIKASIPKMWHDLNISNLRFNR